MARMAVAKTTQDQYRDGYDDGGQPEPEPQLACEKCGKTLATNRALRAHQLQKHSRRSWAGPYCEATGDCPACGLDARTRLDTAAIHTAKRQGRNPLEGQPAHPAKRSRPE